MLMERSFEVQLVSGKFPVVGISHRGNYAYKWPIKMYGVNLKFLLDSPDDISYSKLYSVKRQGKAIPVTGRGGP
jgi:hypothetical protein